jgi:hypothetical protein
MNAINHAMMSMRVRGHSGQEVELLDGAIVRKTAYGADRHRLKRQIEKQAGFQHGMAHPGDRVRAPHVVRTVMELDSFAADMEYITGKDFVQFLVDADRESLLAFAGTIIAFVEANLARSADADVTNEVLSKLGELEGRGVPARFIEAGRRSCAEPVIIPLGPCHGDLTLSNILFKGSQIYLIDFLDCFVESPIHDLVKIRQDTRFGWSLMLYDAPFDETKVRVALRFLDREFAAAFAGHLWCQRHYEFFQALNFMRIFPYCKNQQTEQFVVTRLERMLEKG